MKGEVSSNVSRYVYFFSLFFKNYQVGGVN